MNESIYTIYRYNYLKIFSGGGNLKVDEYIKGKNWRVHPDWIYCK